MTDATHNDGKSTRAHGWKTLALAVAALLLFMYVIGPLGLQMPAIKPIADLIDEKGINANGYYYTDVAEFSDAEMYLKNSMQYAPDGEGDTTPNE